MSARRGTAIAQAVAFRAFPFHDISAATEQRLLACLADPSLTTAFRRALADRADDFRASS